MYNFLTQITNEAIAVHGSVMQGQKAEAQRKLLLKQELVDLT